MRYADLRRLLHDIERVADRWRLVEGLSVRRGEDWQAVVAAVNTGLWHTVREYTDLTVARPTLPAGVTPPLPRDLARLERLDGRPAHDSGRLGWGELLAVIDGVATAYPAWRLALLARTHRDPECYQVYALDRRAATVWPAHWIDTPADWARLRDGASPAP